MKTRHPASFRSATHGVPDDERASDAASESPECTNAFLVEHLGEPIGSDWRGRTDERLWPGVAARIRADDLTVMRTGAMHLRSQGVPFEDGAHDFLVITLPMAGEGGRTNVLGAALTGQNGRRWRPIAIACPRLPATEIREAGR